MKVEILQLLEGAEKAEGMTVIIDVFRAFTLEAYLFSKGAARIFPLGDLQTARRLKKENPDWLLFGERHGRICDGFDFGNSPSAVRDLDFTGKTIVHTTSAGTQGIAGASRADRILTGSLVNAAGTAEYIRSCRPEKVSLVCMGWEGKRETEEDTLCAEYIRSLLEGQRMEDIGQRAYELRFSEGKKFFDPAQQDVFPEDDFHMCVLHDLFDFAVVTETENGMAVNRRYDNA